MWIWEKGIKSITHNGLCLFHPFVKDSIKYCRISPLVYFLILTLNCWANPFSPDQGYGTITNVIFHSCYDGDTWTFTLPDLHPTIGHKVKVRLAGIDTHEIKGKCEHEKTKVKIVKLRFNNILKTAKTIELKNIARGKYFRIAAEI